MGVPIGKLGYEAKLARASPILCGIAAVRETWQCLP
jgi:hypothetical protein